LERWELAKINNCEFIEIPADFIKNKTEIKKTGQKLGEFLKDESIKKIYSKQNIDNKLIKYILHTEPSLPRNDGFGLRHQAALKWYDEDWINKINGGIIINPEIHHKNKVKAVIDFCEMNY